MENENSASILVVDDDPDDSFLLARQLHKAKLDHDLTLFKDGKEALDFLLKTKTPPTVLFLDLHLPGLDGVQLLRRIREEPTLKAMTVLIMTGSNDPEERKLCEKIGVTAFYPKPIPLDEVTETLTHL